jgi:ATP-dependent Clp protease ATP-binding subunit ClpA
VFERFTERARQVVVLAQDEARLLKHNYIGTEHLLLGLLREEEGLAARVLESLNVSVEPVRDQVARIVGQGEEVTSGQIPFTPRAKKVLELSLREALALGHEYIGTEHILLGVAREREGVAARILLDFEVDAEKLRESVMAMLGGRAVVAESYKPESPPLAPEFLEELERVRDEKEKAMEAQEFDKAATLRDRERELRRAARELETVWKWHPAPRGFRPTVRPPHVSGIHAAPVSGHRPRLWINPLLWFGAGAVVLAAGLLLGWLIWG